MPIPISFPSIDAQVNQEPPKLRKGRRTAAPSVERTSAPVRRRGGQPGNTNRLVHGLYSARLPRELTAAPNPRTGQGLQFEIALARVRLAQLMDQQKRAPKRSWLTYERAILNYLTRITSLIDAHTRRAKLAPDVMALLDSLRFGDDSPVSTTTDHSNLIRTSNDFYGITRD